MPLNIFGTQIKKCLISGNTDDDRDKGGWELKHTKSNT